VSLTSDRVCLDYRNYEGNPVRLMFRRCTPLGDIAQLMLPIRLALRGLIPSPAAIACT
jgi:hypothetical protein